MKVFAIYWSTMENLIGILIDRDDIVSDNIDAVNKYFESKPLNHNKSECFAVDSTPITISL